MVGGLIKEEGARGGGKGGYVYYVPLASAGKGEEPSAVMKSRKVDCWRLNSPDLSEGETQSVIFWAAYGGVRMVVWGGGRGGRAILRWVVVVVVRWGVVEMGRER